MNNIIKNGKGWVALELSPHNSQIMWGKESNIINAFVLQVHTKDGLDHHMAVLVMKDCESSVEKIIEEIKADYGDNLESLDISEKGQIDNAQ